MHFCFSAEKVKNRNQLYFLFFIKYKIVFVMYNTLIRDSKIYFTSFHFGFNMIKCSALN